MRSLYLIGILILNLVLGGLLTLAGGPAQAQNTDFSYRLRLSGSVRERLADVLRRESFSRRSQPQNSLQSNGRRGSNPGGAADAVSAGRPDLQPGRGPAAAAVRTPKPDAVFDTLFASGTPTPDPSIAVGPQYVVVTTNKQIGFFTQDGGSVGQVLLSSFFPTDPTPEISEATVVWDPYLRVFVLVARGVDETNKVSRLDVAISSGSNPTGFWLKRTFAFEFPTPADRTHKLLFPRLGYDQSNYYFTSNIVPFGADQVELNAIFAINKFDLFDPLPTLRGIAGLTLPAPPNAPNTLPRNLTPVQANSPVGQTMVVADAGEFGLAVYKIQNFFAIPPLTPVVTREFISTAASSLYAQQVPPTAPQPGAAALPVGDFGIRKAVYVNGRIWTAQTLMTTGGIRSVLFRIDPRLATAQSSVLEYEQTATALNGEALYHPSVIPGQDGFALAAFHGSSFGVAPTLFVSRYNPTDGRFGPAIRVAAGATGFGGRLWGRTTDVALDVATSGAKVWAVGEATSTPAEVRMVAARINLREVELLQPNGNETVAPAETMPITWTPGSAGPDGVTIRLSRDGGATYPEIIAANTEDDGSHLWVVTGPISLQARIRVEIADAPSLNDASDGNFTISGAPSDKHCKIDEDPDVAPIPIPDNRSGQEWVEMDLHYPLDKIIHGFVVDVDITHPFIGDLEVELQHPDGSRILLHDETGGGNDNLTEPYPPTRIAEEVNSARSKLLRKRTLFFDAASGRTDRTRPWKLRVRDLKAGDVGQINKWCLTIIGPRTGELNVTAPNGGERWDVGSTRKITWTNGPNTLVDGDVLVQLSRDGGNSYSTLTQVPAGNGEYNWKVTGPETKQARVKVISVLEPVQLDVSDADFSILNAFVRVDRPALDERVATGKTYVIRWDSVPDTDTVKIELSRDDGRTFRQIAAAAPNTGSYNWTPVAGQDDSTNAVLRITANGGPARSDNSERFIIETPAIVVLSPDGGEVWHTFHRKTVQWRVTGVEGDVKIEVSRKADRTDWTVIGTAPAADGTFDWTVAGNPSTTAKVRVSSVNEPDKKDESDSNFEIRAMSVTVTRPNGGEILGVGTAQGITWTSEGVLGSIDVELSRNGGATWETLFSNVANTGAAVWGVSGPATEQALVRVKTHDYPVDDASNAVFSIVPSAITVLAPNGGEELRVGRTVDLRWAATGFSSTVKIELSRDGGANWQTLFAGVENDGVQPWLVTAPDTAQALIRVSSDELSNVADASNSAFTIVTPRVAVLSPNGSERWFTQSTQTITWTTQGIDTTGVAGNVRIELTRDGGQTWETLHDSTPNDGRQEWPVAGNPTGNARVRVTARDVSGAADESNGPFSIVSPTVVVTQPATAAEVLIGTPQVISWTSAGVDGNVKIELTRDGGASWETLAADTENDGVELWTVNGSPTAEAFIRITPVQRPDVAGVSGEFAISRATLNVTAPTRRTKAAIGQQLVVTWDGSVVRSGTGTVTVELSRNGGRSWTPIIVDTPNDGIAVWIATGASTSKARVRVIWNADPSVRDDSDGNFRIAKRKAVKKSRRK